MFFTKLRTFSDSDSDIDNATTKKVCPHLNGAVHIDQIKRVLLQNVIFRCKECHLKNLTNFEDDLWICLQCGHMACTQHRHNIKTEKLNEIVSHNLAICPEREVVWCLACDCEISPKFIVSHMGYQTSRILDVIQVIDIVRRWYRRVNCLIQDRAYCYLPPAGLTVSPDQNGQVPVRGLNNLGLTCYLNAAIQCLAHTPGILPTLDAWINSGHSQTMGASRSTLLPVFPDAQAFSRLSTEVKSVVDYPSLVVNLTTAKHPVTKTLYRVIKMLLDPTAQAPSGRDLMRPEPLQAVSPRELLQEVSQLRPSYNNSAPEDSHEFLRTLIELLKSEELLRTRVAILNRLRIPRTINPDTVLEISERSLSYFLRRDPFDGVTGENRCRVKHYGRLAQDSTVWDRLFGGWFVSSFRCQGCSALRTTLEPFLDLLVPLPSGKRMTHKYKKTKVKAKCESINDELTDSTSRLVQSEASSSDIGALADIEDNTDSTAPSNPSLVDSPDHNETAFSTYELLATQEQAIRPLLVETSLKATELEKALCCMTSPSMISAYSSCHCKSASSVLIDQERPSVISSRVLIHSPPLIMTIALKRFHQVCFGQTRKIYRHVSFPIILDMSPYCSELTEVSSRPLYKLYAVVEHLGRMNNGHYVTYICKSKSTIQPFNIVPLNQVLAPPNCESLVNQYRKLQKFPKTTLPKSDELEQHLDDSSRKWYCLSDNHARSVTETHVLASKAYLLFYQRIS